jgi:hypothetical protein
MHSVDNQVQAPRADAERSHAAEAPRDFRFRYGYICRLIDDGELQALPAPLRTRTRTFHKAAYWKSLSLMRRDADHVLRVRRERMAAEQQWNFEFLLNDYAKMKLLMAKLTVAGLSHSIHLGAGLDSARQACLEFEAFLTSPASSSLHATTA